MGDKVLKDVAADLGKMFRNTDVISRLGGDEFIIYMKAVPEEEWVRRRTEEVVRTVRRWVTDGTTNIQVSASVGVVSTNGMERVYEDMYRAADIAMYFSKAQGGNQAIFYSKDLVSQARAVPATTREGRPEEGAKGQMTLTLKANGAATLTGTLPNKANVSVTSTLYVNADGAATVRFYVKGTWVVWHLD